MRQTKATFILNLKRAVAVALLFCSLSATFYAQTPPAKDYSKLPARVSSAWVRDAVIYQIFPRQYSQKGDFNSITNDLGRLQSLGINVLWLMPIHPIGQLKKKGTIGSPYAVRDYYAVNPDYGTPDDLKRLIAEAHQRGMKVIIDIVANHTSWDSVLMKNPAFYTHNKKGEIIPPVPDWNDVADLNYDNPELRRYMIDMLKFWVREYKLDGFRCDVAGFVPTDFWEQARAEVDQVNPDTIWLAEWNSPDLLVKAFDLDYDWALHSTLTDVIQGNKPAAALRASWQTEHDKFPVGALRMRFSDNHDERRAIARFGERGALAASALMFMLDGVPLIYNGMEVGDTAESGYPALFEKLPIFWDIAVRRPEFPRFYAEIVKLRKAHEALRRGDVVWLKNGDETRVLTWLRRTKNEEILCVLNLSSQPATTIIETPNGRYEELTPSLTDKTSAVAPERAVGLPAVALEAWGWRVFRRLKN